MGDKIKERAGLENEAILRDNGIIDHTDCEECLEDYLFLMKDNYHEFCISLRTLIACLSMAEKEGAIPRMGSDWWTKVYGRY